MGRLLCTGNLPFFDVTNGFDETNGAERYSLS